MSQHIVRVPSHRLDHRHLDLSATDRLHLLLAACSALTATSWGAAMAVVLVAVVVARRQARHAVDRSVAVRRGVLAPAQRAGVLDAAGHGREAVAGP